MYLDLLVQLADLLADFRTVHTDGAAAAQLETETNGGLLQLPDHVKLTLGLLVEILLVRSGHYCKSTVQYQGLIEIK